jgi:hypothetical protein
VKSPLAIPLLLAFVFTSGTVLGIYTREPGYAAGVLCLIPVFVLARAIVRSLRRPAAQHDAE